jgi:hypothetical protein
MADLHQRSQTLIHNFYANDLFSLTDVFQLKASKGLPYALSHRPAVLPHGGGGYGAIPRHALDLSARAAPRTVRKGVLLGP